MRRADAGPGAALPANLVHFVRYLRHRGLPVGPATTADLAAVVDALGLDDRADLYLGFRSLVIARPSQQPAFDEAFEMFFGYGRMGTDDIGLPAPPPDSAPAPIMHGKVPVLAPDRPATEDLAERLADTVGGSYAERLGDRDFGDLTPEEQDQVRRLIDRMVWHPAEAMSRRRAPNRRGDRPDLRRTLRGVSGPHGDLMPLSWSRPRRRRRPLVVVADVSGSMERYTEMFLYFVHAAQGRLGRVEAFVFSTRLSRITRELRIRQPEAALHKVAATVPDWSGGTRIGEVLEAFNRDWSRRVTAGGAVGLVISDGWDTGDTGLLDTEMARFARSMHRVVWLNPLAGRTGFAPETRGMRTVLPYVDDFLPAASLADLRSVVSLLESVPARRGSAPR